MAWRSLLWLAGLVVVLGLGCGSRPEPKTDGQREANPPAPASLDDLTARYKELGLPFPPPEATLVRFEASWSHVGPRGESVPVYELGFLVKPGTKETPPTLLVGTQTVQPARRVKVTPVEPKPAAAGDVAACSRDPVFEINAGLATAVQCQARGWHDLARALLDSSLRQECGHHFSPFHQKADLPPKSALAQLAWAHWGNELIKPDTDRKVIAQRMRGLIAAEKSLDTDINRKLLQSLEAALVPSKAGPGSVEALIDDLVDLTNPRRKGGRDELAPRYERLLLKGFDAVPRLIEHLDDERLTRAVRVGVNNFPTYHLRVDEIVSDLLQDLAGEELGKDWLERRRGYPVEKGDARAWWRKARQAGEEAYLAAHVLTDDRKAEWPNNPMLRVLAKKYPRRLPRTYRTLLDERPRMQSWAVAEAVGAAPLPRDQKVELFAYAAGRSNLEHRRAALRELRRLDPERFVTVLVRTLDGLPATPLEPYWGCPEASFARLVLETDDPRAWQALAKAARRADVGLRLQMLDAMDADKGPRRRRLDFLAGFLDDATVRDKASNLRLFEGPCAGFDFPRLEVRNFAAGKIARILQLPAEVKPTWTADQWADLRARVRKALGAEAKPEPGPAPKPNP